MTRRWEPCIAHCGEDAEAFVNDYFSNGDRRVVLLAGCGFDPRSTHVARRLAGVLGSRVRGLFLREQRSGSNSHLGQLALDNTEALKSLIPNSRLESFPVFSTDNATVGGRRVIEAVRNEVWTGVTDIVVDLSALSVGVGFPLVRFIYESAAGSQRNVHVLVTDDPDVDSDIQGIPSERADTLHGFRGSFGLDDASDVTILWIPLLTKHRSAALRRVFASLTEHKQRREIDVCPILPFPARYPRRGDELVEHYQIEIETIWGVDGRDILYADERKPLDVYRILLDIDDARLRVFRQLGGSMTVVSPFGSKAQSLGALMAAVERNFPVMYVETLAYQQSPSSRTTGELVHVWLCGDAYTEPHSVMTTGGVI